MQCSHTMCSVFYMRPSRFFPKETRTTTIIDNLVYVMNAMLDSEKACYDGIGLIANMSEWSKANFSVPYWHKFMMTLQGQRVPTRVELFLLVNPPSWFGSIWSVMKPMLSDSFRRKVHIVGLDDVQRFLAPGYERYVPDEFPFGQNNTEEIVRRFIEDRRLIESNPALIAQQDM